MHPNFPPRRTADVDLISRYAQRFRTLLVGFADPNSIEMAIALETIANGIRTEVACKTGVEPEPEAPVEVIDGDHDPVVLWDPVAGPITDSQLKKICEDAYAVAHSGKPNLVPTD
jgi:hypothetical protein